MPGLHQKQTTLRHSPSVQKRTNTHMYILYIYNYVHMQPLGPLLKVKLLVGPTCKIPVSSFRSCLGIRRSPKMCQVHVYMMVSNVLSTSTFPFTLNIHEATRRKPLMKSGWSRLWSRAIITNFDPIWFLLAVFGVTLEPWNPKKYCEPQWATPKKITFCT